MSRDSHQRGYSCGHADGLLAGAPRREPAKLLADGDDGYRQYWQGYSQGYYAGELERLEREAVTA